MYITLTHINACYICATYTYTCDMYPYITPSTYTYNPCIYISLSLCINMHIQIRILHVSIYI